MKSSMIDRWLCVLVVSSATFIAQDVLAVSCGDICTGIEDYAADVPGAGVKYYEWFLSDCTNCFCTSCNCIWPGPTLPKCVPDPLTPQQRAPVNNADLACPLNPASNAQTLRPRGVGQFVNTGNEDICSN
jgi:hypothetical protein